MVSLVEKWNKTVIIPKKELIYYVSTSIIKTIISIDSDKYILLIVDNINYNLISKLKLHINNDNNNYKTIHNNVTLASAITSYARIHMIPFKIDPCTKYTDTDSIFTTRKLDDKLIGKELGLMKDELDGNIIKEAYFFRNKTIWFLLY